MGLDEIEYTTHYRRVHDFQLCYMQDEMNFLQVRISICLITRH
jgi:hypothetical protein